MLIDHYSLIAILACVFILNNDFRKFSHFVKQGPVVQKPVNFKPGLALTLG